MMAVERLLYVFVSMCVICAEPFVPFDEKWFQQEVDHFNFYSATYGQATYKQKYLVQGKDNSFFDNKNICHKFTMIAIYVITLP